MLLLARPAVRQVARQAQGRRVRRQPRPPRRAGRRPPGAAAGFAFRHRPHARAEHGARFPTTSSSRNRARIARCRKPRTFRSRLRCAPTRRSAAKPRSTSTRAIRWPKPISTWPMVCTTRPPTWCASRSSASRDRRDLKLKLLEVFFVWGNKEQFLTIGARARRDARRIASRASGKRSSSWASRLPPKIRCSRMAAAAAAPSASTSISMPAAPAAWTSIPSTSARAWMSPAAAMPMPVDLDLGSALRDPDATGEGLATARLATASGQTTREMTVKMTPAGSEAPTVEQPALRPLDEPTIREKVEGAMRRKLSLGSDRRARARRSRPRPGFARTDGFADRHQARRRHAARPGRQRARRWSRASTRIHSACWRAAAARHGGGNADDSQLTEHGASGTWFLTERELGGDVDLTKGRSIDPNSTASMAKFEMPEDGLRHFVDLAPRGHRSQQPRLPGRAHAAAAADGAARSTSTSAPMASTCRAARPKSSRCPISSR